MRIIVTLGLALLALLPASVSAHEGTAISVVGEIRPNGPIEITGEDFGPGDVVRIELRKQGVAPIQLGTVPVETDGSFAATLHVPATAGPGIYQLAADGQESAETEVTVLEPEAGSEVESEPAEGGEASSDRPASETVALAAAAVLLAAVGLGFLALSRTRPHVAVD